MNTSPAYYKYISYTGETLEQARERILKKRKTRLAKLKNKNMINKEVSKT